MAGTPLRGMAAGAVNRHALYPVIVAGGGLAGSSVALRLAAAGREVLLLEKSRAAHDKVCGEFLSTEALQYLSGMGVDAIGLGAVPVRRVRLSRGERLAEAPLPFPAMSLSRRCLDEALLLAAANAGAEVRRGAQVNGVQPGDGGWHVEVGGAEALRCTNLFVATGKHDLRRLPRPEGSHSGLVGMKMYFRLGTAQAAALRDAVELLLFPGGYAGLQPVEGGRANLCLLVERGLLRRFGGGWDALLDHMLRHLPHLRTRLGGAEPLLEAPLAVAAIPYGHVQRHSSPGLWRLGDQAAVIPSFSGDGMSIALHSAALAAEHFLRGSSEETFQQDLAGQVRARIRLATTLSHLLVSAPWLATAAQLFPALLPQVAALTRIPARSLLAARRVA